MNRALSFSLLAVSAAWAIYLSRRAASNRVVPVTVAADQLRKAWANNHTIA